MRRPAVIIPGAPPEAEPFLPQLARMYVPVKELRASEFEAIYGLPHAAYRLAMLRGAGTNVVPLEALSMQLNGLPIGARWRNPQTMFMRLFTSQSSTTVPGDDTKLTGSGSSPFTSGTNQVVEVANANAYASVSMAGGGGFALSGNQWGAPANPNTAVAAGSNGVNVNTFAGSGTLNTTTNPQTITPAFPSSGSLYVYIGTNPGTAQVEISYTGTTSSSFTGCTTLTTTGTSAGALATNNVISGLGEKTTASQQSFPQSTGNWGVINGFFIATCSNTAATAQNTAAPTSPASAAQTQGTGILASTFAGGTAFFYKITSVTAAGESAASTETSTLTPTSSQVVTLSWTAPAGPTPLAYRVYRTSTSGTYNTPCFVTEVPGTQTNALDTGASSGNSGTTLAAGAPPGSTSAQQGIALFYANFSDGLSVNINGAGFTLQITPSFEIDHI